MHFTTGIIVEKNRTNLKMCTYICIFLFKNTA